MGALGPPYRQRHVQRHSAYSGPMRTGKIALLLAVLAAVCTAAGGTNAHEELSNNAEAQAAQARITPAPPFAEPYGRPGARAALEAANALLAALNAEQADAIVLPIDSPLRGNWSNLPSGVTRFERNGLRLGDLTPVSSNGRSNFSPRR